MDWIAGWFAGAFLAAVFTNDESDKEINGCQMLDYWFLKIRIDAALDDTPGCPWQRTPERRSYQFLLLLLSFRHWDQARWLGERIYLGKDHNEPAEKWSNSSPVGGFTLRLFEIHSGRKEPEAPCPPNMPALGAYGGLFANWNSPERLKASIAEACDYHVTRMSADTEIEYDIPEFGSQPYNVLPVEILALRAVRERLGLDTPFPSHPLLESPFVTNLPTELPLCTGGLLQDVIAATEKVLPGFLTDDPLHIRPGVVDIPPPSPPLPLPTFPMGLQRTVDTSGHLWWAKQEVVIRYHIPSADVAQRCGEELFQQMIREYPNRKRIQEIEIHVTGIPEDMVTAYQAFQQVSARHPEVEQWLLGEVSRFELDFETSEGVLVRNYEYWTEGGKRNRSEMKPAEG